MALEHAGERITGVLNALISVEDFRSSILADRLLKAVNTKAAVQ